MLLYRHPKEARKNKAKAGKLISEKIIFWWFTAVKTNMVVGLCLLCKEFILNGYLNCMVCLSVYYHSLYGVSVVCLSVYYHSLYGVSVRILPCTACLSVYHHCTAPLYSVSVRILPLYSVSVCISPLYSVSVRISPLYSMSVRISPLYSVSVRISPLYSVSVRIVPLTVYSVYCHCMASLSLYSAFIPPPCTHTPPSIVQTVCGYYYILSVFILSPIQLVCPTI